MAKTTLTILILLLTTQLYSQEYGEDYTLLLKCKSEQQAKNILRRYQVADIGNTYFKSEEDYYIELVDETDLQEVFFIEDRKYLVIPEHLHNNITLIEFIKTEDNLIFLTESGEPLN